MVYNKPNGCSATGALALGPDYQQKQQQQQHWHSQVYERQQQQEKVLTPNILFHFQGFFFRLFFKEITW
jgi:hypothetical protein